MKLTPIQLKQIRKVCGLTQRNIASLVGVSNAYLNRVEKGKQALSDKINFRIINALDISQQKMTEIERIYNEFQKRSDEQ